MEKLPVFVLMRTSNRPTFFEKTYESIRGQDYENIILIVHSDDVNDTYVRGDKIIYSERKEVHGNGHYNLYCNKLLQAIPENVDGWYHFIDDDDCYASNDVISRLVENAKEDFVNVGRSQRADGVVYPKTWKGQESFQTECFFLHTKHKDKARWWNRRGGDHYYTKQLTCQMPINWIDDLLICKAMAGKGYGRRYDLMEQKVFHNKKAIVSRCGARGSNKDMLFIRYTETVLGRQQVAGKKDEHRYIHKDYAEQLLKENKIIILEKPE
jgi:glycosyltransferase involved in cell wall biosynthesis